MNCCKKKGFCESLEEGTQNSFLLLKTCDSCFPFGIIWKWIGVCELL